MNKGRDDTNRAELDPPIAEGVGSITVRRRWTRRIALYALVVTLVVLGFNYETLYRLIAYSHVQTPYNEPEAYWDPDSYPIEWSRRGPPSTPVGRVESWVHRWDGESKLRVIGYWQDTRVKQREQTWRPDGSSLVTYWAPDGSILQQENHPAGGGGREIRTSPAWWGGVARQVIPSKVVVEPTGTFRSYYADTAILRSEEHWFRGRPHGVWTQWRPDGRIRFQNHYVDGVQVGSRSAPPWSEEATDQVVHGAVVFVGSGARVLFDDLDLTEAQRATVLGWRDPMIIATFDQSRLDGPVTVYARKLRAYVGQWQQGRPVGVHTAWRLVDVPLAGVDLQGEPLEPRPGVELSWQRTYGDDGEYVDRETDAAPEAWAGLPVKLDYLWDQVSGEVGAVEVRPPLRDRGESQPTWFYGPTDFREVGRGEYVDGKREGVWTFWTAHYPNRYDRPHRHRYQRRYQQGKLVEQRTEPPWWP